MSVEVINFETEAEWLELRTKDLTSTDIAALFGLSPYKTEFELFYEKKAGKVVSIADNERMKWGRRFEAPIAYGVAEDQRWSVKPLKSYMRNPEIRIGSSFDFMISSEEDGDGILEIKNVADLQYKRAWTEEEAPEHIELQIQHQMEVSGLKWCALVAMVGGNSPKVIYRHYDPEIGKAIRAKAESFWQMIANDVPPSADYSRDADMIAQLYSQVNAGEIFDASSDDNFSRMVEQYHQVSKQITELENLRTIYKTQMIEKIGSAEKAIGKWGSISASRTKDTPATIITPEMVGSTYGGRKGFRNFRLTMKKEDK